MLGSLYFLPKRSSGPTIQQISPSEDALQSLHTNKYLSNDLFLLLIEPLVTVVSSPAE